MSWSSLSSLNSDEGDNTHAISTQFLLFARAETFADTLERFAAYKASCSGATGEDEDDLRTKAAVSDYHRLVAATPSGCYLARRLWDVLRPKVEDASYARTPELARLRVVVVGGGIAGLAAAIECALCGAGRVTVLEKRREMDRRNILHLWPSVGQWLKGVGAKVFYSKLLCGGLDCCAIWRLQLCMLKTALLLGVRVVAGAAYLGSEPTPGPQSSAWLARTEPAPPDVGEGGYEFDALIGAEGEHSGVSHEFGFARKTLNFGQAIGITANLQFLGTPEEKGLAEGGFISYLNRAFFDRLKAEDIVLENLVVYRAPELPAYTYMVMTVKAPSLVAHGVIGGGGGDNTQNMLATRDHDKLCAFVRKVATAYGIPAEAQFLDCRGRPDVSLFDFSTKTALAKPSMLVHAGGSRAFVSIIGDAAINPFWPRGTGAANGILSAQDCAWALQTLAKDLRSEARVASFGEEALALHERTHTLLQTATSANVRGTGIEPAARYAWGLSGLSRTDEL